MLEFGQDDLLESHGICHTSVCSANPLDSYFGPILDPLLGLIDHRMLKFQLSYGTVKTAMFTFIYVIQYKYDDIYILSYNCIQFNNFLLGL